MKGRSAIDPEDRWFGQWLAKKRAERQRTQQDLADVISSHQTTIAKIESGHQTVSYSQVVRLARELGSPALPFAPTGLCEVCVGEPPSGFTCNACGVSS